MRIPRRALVFLLAAPFATPLDAQVSPSPLGYGAIVSTCGTHSYTVGTAQPVEMKTNGEVCASGGGPPPTCSNALDYSQACNSQYFVTLLF